MNDPLAPAPRTRSRLRGATLPAAVSLLLLALACIAVYAGISTSPDPKQSSPLFATAADSPTRITEGAIPAIPRSPIGAETPNPLSPATSMAVLEFSGFATSYDVHRQWGQGSHLTIVNAGSTLVIPVAQNGAFSHPLDGAHWTAGEIVNARVLDHMGGIAFVGQVAIESPCWIACGTPTLLRLVVLDGLGRPVPDATVSLDMPIPGNPWWLNSLNSGTTDALGAVQMVRYLDPLFVPESCNITVVESDQTRIRSIGIPLSQLATPAGYVLTLRPTSELRFRVERPDGSLAQDGVVAVAASNHDDLELASARKPLVNGFAIFRMQQGLSIDWCVVCSDGSRQFGAASAGPGMQDIRVVLDASSETSRITVRPYDPIGLPVLGATVTLFPGVDNLEAGAISRYVAEADSSGLAYSARVPNVCFPLRIMTFKSQYGFAGDVLVDRPRDAEIDVRFHARGNLTVSPRLSSGYACFRSGPVHIVARELLTGQVGRLTKLEGPFTLEWLLAGDYEVHVAMSDGTYLGSCTCTVPAGGDSIADVTMYPALVVEGQVRDSGRPAAGISIRIEENDNTQGLPWAECTTGVAGSFRLTTLHDSPVRLRLTRQGEAARFFPVVPNGAPVVLDW